MQGKYMQFMAGIHKETSLANQLSLMTVYTAWLFALFTVHMEVYLLV